MVWIAVEQNSFSLFTFNLAPFLAFHSRKCGLPHFGHSGHPCTKPSRHCGTISRTKAQRHKVIYYSPVTIHKSHSLDFGHPLRHFGESLSRTVFCFSRFLLSTWPLFLLSTPANAGFPILDNLDTGVQNLSGVALSLRERYSGLSVRHGRLYNQTVTRNT